MIIFTFILIAAIILAAIFTFSNIIKKILKNDFEDFLMIMWTIIGVISGLYILIGGLISYTPNTSEVICNSNISKIEQVNQNSNLYLTYNEYVFIIRDIEVIQYIKKKDFKLKKIRLRSFFNIPLETQFILEINKSKRFIELTDYVYLN